MRSMIVTELSRKYSFRMYCVGLVTRYFWPTAVLCPFSGLEALKL